MDPHKSKARTILMVTNNYFPYQGGVAQSVHASTQALRARGHSVVLVTLDVAKSHDDPPYVIRVPSLIRMRLKNNPLALPINTNAFLKNIIDWIQPDIIHTHHPWLLGYSALKHARSLELPLVFTHHTLYESYAHYVPLPPQLTSLLIRQRVRAYCSQVNHIIAPSTPVAQAIAQHSPTTAVSVIPSPIRTCFFTARSKDIAQRKRTISLLYVGRFVAEKNITALLDAVSLLPAESYTLSCVGYGYLLPALQHYAYEKLKLSPSRVQFHPCADAQGLLVWYQQADLFLFASASDTQGLVLAESMACATPVIALDGPGQRSLIINGSNGYIVKDSCAMAQKIIYLLQHQTVLQELSNGARRTASHYTSETHADRLLALYETIMAKRGPRNA